MINDLVSLMTNLLSAISKRRTSWSITLIQSHLDLVSLMTNSLSTKVILHAAKHGGFVLSIVSEINNIIAKLPYAYKVAIEHTNE
jgi:hypothetical protein